TTPFANHNRPSGDLAAPPKGARPGCTPSNASNVLSCTVTSGCTHHRCSSVPAISTSPHCVYSQRALWLSSISAYTTLQGRPFRTVRVCCFPSFHPTTPSGVDPNAEPSEPTIS